MAAAAAADAPLVDLGCVRTPGFKRYALIKSRHGTYLSATIDGKVWFSLLTHSLSLNTFMCILFLHIYLKLPKYSFLSLTCLSKQQVQVDAQRQLWLIHTMEDDG